VGPVPSRAVGLTRASPRPATSKAKGSADPAGLAERRLACEAVNAVVKRRRALDDTLDALATTTGLDDRDRGLLRAIATVTIRHLGLLRRVLAERLREGLPRAAGPLEDILLTGAAQLLFLDVPDHAAVDTAVSLARQDPGAARYASLVNAVLRAIARDRAAILASHDALADNMPPWLAQRWIGQYGPDLAARIAAALASEPGIDISVKADAPGWAQRLDALLLPTGSLRLRPRTAVRDLPGFSEGAWWVQDAAAALAARLLQPRPGLRILDLCAAPGGKTAQLASAGAAVVALDRSGPRLARLRSGMERLGLAVETIEGDALGFEGGPFDAVLLDAPCSATGTIRRHPDVPWVKTAGDIGKLAALQARLLDKAMTLVRPGGHVVYCTCSLEREEGEAQIEALLARDPGVRRVPIEPSEIGGLADAVSASGDVRTLPFLLPSPDPRLAGMDGFFIARLTR
jgi:16S rRNA (cytosine967-C5)-methyltransferase